jgi:hypothetical protein
MECYDCESNLSRAFEKPLKGLSNAFKRALETI